MIHPLFLTIVVSFTCIHLLCHDFFSPQSGSSEIGLLEYLVRSLRQRLHKLTLGVLTTNSDYPH